MAHDVAVSAIIPTWNRRELVLRALESVLAQTRPVDEIIVVDDGSTDGTGAAIAARHGERVRHVWQENAGVSAARNHGMELARGRYFALLDSDDEWLPDKTRLQLEFLEARPDYGMALCDVVRMDAAHRDIEVFRRRDLIPEDGMVLRWVLREPALVPASVMLRREAWAEVGGFDTTLATGEDLDFHLRVARRWPIGIVEQPLVRAMRGHDGLSSLARTYDDYLRVIERAVAAAAGVVPDGDRDAALAAAYRRNARGLIFQRRWREALALARKAWRLDPAQRGDVLALLPQAGRRALAALLRRG
jgi:glycosyltransferase involved in cell wall biosynthesis